MTISEFLAGVAVKLETQGDMELKVIAKQCRDYAMIAQGYDDGETDATGN